MRRLRSVYVLLALSGVAVPPVAAQPHIGLTIGPSYATLSGSLIDSSKGAYGVHMGLNFEHDYGSRWLLDVELAYSQKGVSDTPFDGEILDFRHNYFELPITLNRLFQISGGPWAVSPYAGVAVALNLDCGFRYEGESEYTDCEEGTPGGNAASYDIGIPIGVGLRRRYPGGSGLGAEIRYTFGLRNAFDQEGQTARNGSLQVLFSFVIPLTSDG